jgi:Tol biopolymer transport system component
MLCGCGGGSDASGGSGGGSTSTTPPPPPPPPATFNIGGTISGLTGSGLTLQNNSGDNLSVSRDGTIIFANALQDGSAYNVTVLAQPSNPGQRCTVANGGGTVAGRNVTSVQVSCVTGQTVVISRRAGGTQGDLYAVNEFGGALTPLANSTDDEIFQGITSDGRVVFIRETGSQADVYSIKLDGSGLVALANTATREVLGGNGVPGAGFTPTGKVIISREQTTGIPRVSDLYLINPDGSGEVRLTASGGKYNGATAAGRIVFSTNSAVLTSGQTDIFSVNEDGTDLRDLLIDPEEDEFASMTPGGRVIFSRIVGAQRDLYSVTADGRGLVALAKSSAEETFVTVTPDDHVIFRSGTDGDLFSIASDGTGLATLANSTDVEGYVGTLRNGKIVFGRIRSGSSPNVDLYSVNIDGTGLTGLGVTDSVENALGEGNAGQVLFARYDATQSDLFAINADGTAEVRLTHTPDQEDYDCGTFCGSFQILTTKGQFVFQRRSASNAQGDLYSIAPDGTGEVVIANSADDETLETTTVNGRIIYSRDVGGQPDLYSVDGDGKNVTTLSNSVDIEQVMAVR